MKYRDENEDFQDLYFKTGDTLPIGTEVDYDGETAPAGWEEIDEPKETYSTDEVVTNKVWVDGKPIYRKTFTGTINDSTKLLENVDYLINAYGTVYMNNNTRTLNYYELYNNLQYFVNLRGSSNNIYFACVVAGQPSNPTNCNIVLEYTKTTDQGGA